MRVPVREVGPLSEADGGRAEREALRAERDALERERDRLRSILEASKVALGPGVAESDEALPKGIEGRIGALERTLARIRNRAIGELPEMESPPDIRLLTIYVLAAVALDGARTA